MQTRIIEETVTEVGRLHLLHQALTESLGSLLPGLEKEPHLQRILDIGCGPGSWALDVAKAFAEVEIIGIDSGKMIAYAQAQQWAEHEEIGRVQFQTMDTSSDLSFPDESFDLVHGRHLSMILESEDWLHLLKEGFRVLRPGGIISLLEGDTWNMGAPAGCKALAKLSFHYSEALFRTGRSFCGAGFGIGVSPVLAVLLDEAGFKQIDQRAFLIPLSSRAKAYDEYLQNAIAFLKLIQPFLISAGVSTPSELGRLYPQALEEMRSMQFQCHYFYILSLARRPEGG